MSSVLQFDIVVVGAGPAGIAAAISAADGKRSVALVDDNPDAGGQIWRGSTKKPVSRQAAVWLERLRKSPVTLLRGWQIVDQPELHRLTAQTQSNSCQITYRKLILATGARERFLPFPGWTLPNVFGAGGLQAMAKSGLDVRGKRVVIAGTGPLLLPVAAYLRQSGANVLLIAEQSNLRSLVRLGLYASASPQKLWQAATLGASLRGIPYRTSSWPVRAYGSTKVEGVDVRTPRGIHSYNVDYLACGFHLVPNNELAALLECRMEDGFVKVDEWQRTSVDNVYCAGEPTGIGGVLSSVIEGQIAGYAASGNLNSARKLHSRRNRNLRFQKQLARATALRQDLLHLADPDTIVCRCEDVRFQSLKNFTTFREAKMQTRCGMGPCQGRICGAAVNVLFGWKDSSVRPPIFPATAASWTMQSESSKEHLRG